MEKRLKKFAKIVRARELRKDLTEAEQILWQHLRNRSFYGKKFRRQHIFLGFIIDFYCAEEKLGIELDGHIHYKQKEYDAERQSLIEDSGIRILRFKNKAVIENIKEVLKLIKKNLTLLHFNGEGR
ncbi:hypothetical protein A3J44_05730 [candidate division WOR-1 bacterium RIFCSPHIGHO2_02_FULL_45_12]|uniref:DUF559 domain-containing protein n=1 Tax=candidate division WOR-1 bacterium RIFCSPLOWO2_12_FULL_45_9 TaxID=1802568 RepID=A0A1F4RMD8_UNCSA|nr:MAG: hypothetical protein A3J44_05730 [candidate division WOR-1 bacterium RIFCSPHIGHO2_02_FULL_45_12]OGC09296.1 MAG: hypothetical protein A3F86_00370 [candidate division WOR-1 bacterium RIFCSPLOWO2_12_FULL_45_9]